MIFLSFRVPMSKFGAIVKLRSNDGSIFSAYNLHEVGDAGLFSVGHIVCTGRRFAEACENAHQKNYSCSECTKSFECKLFKTPYKCSYRRKAIQLLHMYLPGLFSTTISKTDIKNLTKTTQLFRNATGPSRHQSPQIDWVYCEQLQGSFRFIMGFYMLFHVACMCKRLDTL